MEIKYELEEGAVAPSRAHAADAGWDLTAKETIGVVADLGNVTVHTGVHVLIPEGYVGVISPRSGLTRAGLVTEVGIVDAGYTGELCLAVRYMVSGATHVITKGERIAQLLILPLPETQLVPGNVTSVETDRGSHGFGSTGV